MIQKKEQTIIDIPQTNSRIGAESEYSGDLGFSTSFSILGSVKGNIKGGELLIVYPQGRVEGVILVDYLLVLGYVSGTINAKKGVFFFDSAVVRGNVLSAIIRMQPGVDFEAECNLTEEDNIDIFSISRETFRANIFDQFVHRLDEISLHK